MNAHEECNQSDPPELQLHNASGFPKAKRKTSFHILFDEDPVFSDSEDETEFMQTAFRIDTSSMKTHEKSRSYRDVCQSAGDLLDKVLMFTCSHCKCCKKIEEFLKLQDTDKRPIDSSSRLGYDNAVTPLCSNNIAKTPSLVKEDLPTKKNLISYETFSPLKSPWRVDRLDKQLNLDVEDVVVNKPVKGSNKTCAEIAGNKQSSHSSVDKENCSLRNNLQEEDKLSQEFKNEKFGIKGKVRQTKKTMLRRSQRRACSKKDQNVNPNDATSNSTSLSAHPNASPKSENGNDHSPTNYPRKSRIPNYKLSETDPYHLKYEAKLTRKSNMKLDKRYVTKRLLASIDTTTNRSFSKAVSRKLGRTGGASFDMESLNMTAALSMTVPRRKSRKLYTDDQWLNSEEFLRIASGEE